MLVLAEFHWGWLLAAAVVGLLMGWVGVVQRGGGLSKRGLQWTARHSRAGGGERVRQGRSRAGSATGSILG